MADKSEVTSTVATVYTLTSYGCWITQGRKSMKLGVIQSTLRLFLLYFMESDDGVSVLLPE